MLLKWYALFDKKCAFYRAPFVAENDCMAIRVVGDALRDPSGVMLAAYPADFALYAVGEFDDNSGTFVSDLQPRFLKEVAEYGIFQPLPSGAVVEC